MKLKLKDLTRMPFDNINGRIQEYIKCYWINNKDHISIVVSDKRPNEMSKTELILVMNMAFYNDIKEIIK